MAGRRKDFRVLGISMSSRLARTGRLPVLERAILTLQHLPLNLSCLVMGPQRT